MSKKEKTRFCAHCGKEIKSGDYEIFDGETLCEECLENETVVCSHCGERIWSEDNAGSSSLPLCQNCFDDYYTTCESCGRIIHQDDANYFGSTPKIVENAKKYGIIKETLETYSENAEMSMDAALVLKIWCNIMLSGIAFNYNTQTRRLRAALRQ